MPVIPDATFSLLPYFAFDAVWTLANALNDSIESRDLMESVKCGANVAESIIDNCLLDLSLSDISISGITVSWIAS